MKDKMPCIQFLCSGFDFFCRQTRFQKLKGGLCLFDFLFFPNWKVLIVSFFLLTPGALQAQVPVATCSYPKATANHNQRKIVRDAQDHVYLVFTDSTETGLVVKGIKINPTGEATDGAQILVSGLNPTLAINRSGRIYLVYESADSLSEIRMIQTADFSEWTSPITLHEPGTKNFHPVCDCDSTGKLNVLWIQGSPGTEQSLIYTRVSGDTIEKQKTVRTKNDINDIALANHLLNFNNLLAFSIQHSVDSIHLFCSWDFLESNEILFSTRGSKPCISYNTVIPDYITDHRWNTIRMIYLDLQNQIIEAEFEPGREYMGEHTKATGMQGDEVCIDDVLPPLGYSFLFRQNGNLYLGFSYGMWGPEAIQDTIPREVLYPTLAYKTFNPQYVDYAWMEKTGNAYTLFYKRSEKVLGLNIHDPEEKKGFSVTGFPNPFSERLSIEIKVSDNKTDPVVEIFDLQLRRIAVLKPVNSRGHVHTYIWDCAGPSIKSGIYLIACTAGKNKTVKKVILEK